MLFLYSNELARRSTWTCLSCTARSSGALLATTKGRTSTPIHQRKYSSSKTPSQPKDETRVIAAAPKASSGEAQPATATEPAEKAPSSRARKRKVKDGAQGAVGKEGDNAQFHLPSVPSTRHIAPLASFFSQHRPMSVSHVIPPPVSAQAFSSLFDPPKSTAKSKAANVIYTLSSAVDALDQASSPRQGQAPEEFDLRTAVIQASSPDAEPPPQELDLPARTLHINLQELAKRFRPFVPPPPPVPLAALREAAGRSGKAVKEHKAPKQITWTSTLTVYETTHANGTKSFKTYASPIVRSPVESSLPPRPKAAEVEIREEEDFRGGGQQRSVRYIPPSPRAQPFLGRMRARQIWYEERMNERLDHGVMQMISVKRQRRLKMKKHKYKKLMKRTKNLRRRLDRT
ncbi:MAG: hypothetical protein Q9163_006024 [Psora crenata]